MSRIIIRFACLGALVIAAVEPALAEPQTVDAVLLSEPFGQAAQTSGAAAGPPLSLDAALDEALARNPDLVALRRAYDVALTRPAQARFLEAPTFEARVWQWPINSLSAANTNMYMFGINQSLPGFGKRRLREAVAGRDVDLAEAEIAVRARQVVDQVKQAYAGLFLIRREIAVHHASVELLRQLADAAQAKYVTGGISQQDVLKAVLEVTRIHDHLITLDERTGIAQARFNTLLDRRPDAPIGPLATPRERVLLPAPDALQQLALQHQPELIAAHLAVDRAEEELAVVTQEYKPDFFVSGGYAVMPGQRDSWSAGVGMTWPTMPWARPRLDARKAEAVAEIAVAKAEIRRVENALGLAVQEAYVRVKAAERRAVLLRTTVLPQSRQTLAVSRAAYQTDRADILSIIDNERIRIDAELAYNQALSDFDQALSALERAVGTDVTPDMLATTRVPDVPGRASVGAQPTETRLNHD